MSGMFDKIKDKVDPDMVDKAADAVEGIDKDTIDDVAKKIPGADKVTDKIPDDAGKQAADAARGLFGDKDDDKK